MLDRAKPIITFINRRFEPLRGYHVFMRALPRVLAQVPEAEILLIGSEQQGGYGLPPPKGATWKQLFLDEVKGRIDASRVHFTGPLPHGEMLAALSLSRAHVYYTYPFVLSWSLLEAMASECLVIASDTAPVRDAIRSGENGLLLDFFDHDALAEALVEACRSPERFAPLRKAARETVIADFNRARCSAACRSPRGALPIGLRTSRCRDVTVRRRRVCRRRGAPIWPQFAATTRRNEQGMGQWSRQSASACSLPRSCRNPRRRSTLRKRADSTASSPSTRSPTACRPISSIG